MLYTSVLIAAVTWCVLLAGLCPGGTVAADTVWQWRDSRGQTHFSDKPPPAAIPPDRQTRFEQRSPATAGGLRSGEREALRRMELRMAQRRQQAAVARRRNDLDVAARRSACRANRDGLRTTHSREQRKRHSTYLRRNCW